MRSAGLRVCVLICVVAALLAACGSSAKKAVRTVTAVHTVTAAAPSTDTESAPLTDSVAPTDSTIPSVAVPSISGVVPQSRSGSTLTLSDFFQPDPSWSDEVVSVANMTGVQGIRGDLNCEQVDLELRLNDAFTTLTFDTAQDNTSPESNIQMIVSVEVNNHPVLAKQVPFNKIQKITANMTDANDVQITFKEGEDCGEIYPVVFNASVK